MLDGAAFPRNPNGRDGDRPDGSAGDVDYARFGQDYARYRQPDPYIAAQIVDALGAAETVLNVGAGAGSYEPVDRQVTAVEPSATMRSQRPAQLPMAIPAIAEALPFADSAFDAAMTTFSVHQWSDVAKGLGEVRRVTRGPVVVLTGDPLLLDRYWLVEYAPEVIAIETRRCPDTTLVLDLLGGGWQQPVDIPLHCTDGLSEAYYGRPEMLLDPGACAANSAWSFVDDQVHQRFEAQLRRDLDSGVWDERNGHLRTQPTYAGSLVLLISPGTTSSA
jgi:hypothetical protein